MITSKKIGNKTYFSDGIVLEFIPVRKPKPPKEPAPAEEAEEPIEIPDCVPA